MTGPSLKKRYGQHHLRSGHLCRPLVEYLAPAGERVVEIGPGGGVLTAELLAAGARVWALEADLEWAFELRRRPEARDARVAAYDVLRFPWSRLPPGTMVAGNLPFNVATRILEDLLPHSDVIPRAAFLVQKEVAERLLAGPGESAYGSLSVLVAAQARAVRLGTVGPRSFRPPPKVAATFVGFELHPPPVAPGELEAFIRFIRLAFAQRRKTLRNSLASGLGRERAEAILSAAGLDHRVRAESLDLAAFVELYRVANGSEA